LTVPAFLLHFGEEYCRKFMLFSGENTVRFLDFEKPVAELERKVEELRQLSGAKGGDIATEINRLQRKVHKLLEKTYASLTPWQKVLVARHEERPQFTDYVAEMFPDFEVLAGDRAFANDEALIGGVGHFHGTATLILGQQKGHDTESRIRHNFGMARPAGYRKAKRLIELADKFRLPVISFVNTSGAYPGMDSEEHGQAQAIASCIQACVKANIPILSVIIGEGGSGGAIAIATANCVLMMEHAFYSVISPEGCASILWKTAAASEKAASAQKLTAQDLLEWRVVDHIIPEPVGGAHRDKKAAIKNVERVVKQELDNLLGLDDFKQQRHKRFLQIGR
jgi:acetyl-CoA carboxylase carboxyl transferase subunit alpha